MHEPDGRPPPATILRLDADVGPAHVPALRERLLELVLYSPAAVVTCDVRAIIAPDAGTLEALARLQLTARRLGRGVQLCGVQGRLRAMLELSGLADVLPTRPGPGDHPGCAVLRENRSDADR